MSGTEHPSGGLTPEHVHRLCRNFWSSAVLRAAIKLNVFQLLERRVLSAPQIARRLDADCRYMEAFLDACTALNLLRRADGGYSNTELASACLIPAKPGYVGNLVQHLTNYWQTWGKLDQLIVEGRPELPFDNGFVDATTYWRDYMRGQHDRALADQGRSLAEAVDLTGRRRLLDLGGGAASYSIALCQAYPNLTSRVVDAAESLAAARLLIAEQRLDERIAPIEGDFFTAELGTDSDAVLLSGVVCLLSEADCRRLFRRALDALVPGGLIIVQDFMHIDQHTDRRSLDAMIDLHLLVGFASEGGHRHAGNYSSWLTQAGFTGVRPIPLLAQYSLVVGEKPGGVGDVEG